MTERSRALRLGTRRSVLAMAQSRWVADRLAQRGERDVELVQITTHGDVDRSPLTEIGGTGVFVGALRAALDADEVDVVVHSLKDLPTAADPRWRLAGVPPREDPRDALCASSGRSLAGLPAGSRIGTGSARRAAQLLRGRPDLEVVPIRGNVDTRLGRVGVDLDGVLLAAAGLSRLDRLAAVTEYLAPEQMLPAPGQGALAVECRSADDDVATVVAAALDDERARAETTAERTLLAELGAGCSAPVAALARLEQAAGQTLTLHAMVASPDGTTALRVVVTDVVHDLSTDPVRIGRAGAAQLFSAGAADLVSGARPAEGREARTS